MVAVGRRAEQAALHHCRGAWISRFAGAGSHVQSLQSEAAWCALEEVASRGVFDSGAWVAAYVVDRAGRSEGVVDLRLCRGGTADIEGSAGYAANPAFVGSESAFRNKSVIKG